MCIKNAPLQYLKIVNPIKAILNWLFKISIVSFSESNSVIDPMIKMHRIFFKRVATASAL
jgi:hypothetical protein